MIMKKVLFDLYPIVKGCSTECIFTGTDRQCQIFARAKKRLNKDFDYIILPAGY